jgi:ACS family hexuronate transporter-like MFS transporter
LIGAVSTSAAVSRARWNICALLFFATTISYVDRQVLSLLAPDLGRLIGWDEKQYGYIVTSFNAAYALGLFFVGRIIDRFGVRRGYATVISLWSVAAMAHALASTVLGFGIARFFLGIVEAGNFPAAIKAVAEWFPRKERALATGIFNSGSNIGAVIVPITVPWIAVNFGWRAAFIVTGALGFVWLVLWLWYYEGPQTHRACSTRELLHIRSDVEEAMHSVPWARVAGLRETWAFALGKFLTDPIWWFYLYWLPKFFSTKYGLSLTKLGLPLVVIYCASSIGSIGGGWLSGMLIARGWSVNRARKTTFFICALCTLPAAAIPQLENVWGAVALLSLATAAHQGWSATIFTLVSDLFPRNAVGSVVGFGGAAGSIGGMLFALVVGWILQATGSNYTTLFLMAGSFYLVAFALIQLLTPKMTPVRA